ncbi:MAG: thiolase domain-containing protein [Ardenticatenaceae bacterium]|nr:thiolase domain-containing protein [Anaerolineales bacterium]MCB8921549.1 thiolase domain-containing protein [Ardenticatenaceae bacterium]MCB8991466.1 thiolase domain-containing protein [Ardenticatenaceae bacterium]MCB9003914.1 thiolase domain-containing protein [Ardenticatenaceae bacterium]
MRDVSVIGTSQLPVKKRCERSIRTLGADVVRAALNDAGLERVDALYVSNMLSDELQSQKHVAALVADEAGLAGVEALQVRAATASGAAALRVAYMAVSSGLVETAVVVGVEKMSDLIPTPALAKALDAEREAPDGATLISQNALAMRLYMERYNVSADAFTHFAVNAHRNARQNPNAIFREKAVTADMVRASRPIVPPIRLYDCAPICDGAAAVVLAPTARATQFSDTPVRILAATGATDRFRLSDRSDPLQLQASHLSAAQAFQEADIERSAVDFFELHDAFSIMSCLQLEAVGFATPGCGWQLAEEGAIALNGRIPIATMGGLKARGHPIGATAVYQTCEIVQQLTGRAGPNQLTDPHIAMLQSIGGAATTVFTFLFGGA